ncbi:hypothetical protein HN512_01230 [Candidatus Peregrinibacteria bacterium]|nr:hypothetical protein [Candidatus Peregrinibacteria bacterium]MBT3598440.1 hypothetical protein [Candidatus Peregrinibacteria bacterium]MBT4367065.1 hypothetical protein [Candidatus Peregrinibacteria bacterium]MBT4585345.1 hypothetical protein [Candidatus Peregrinibacteria bacterium]MBT6730891.1 hypothetical protein [Candidatus Peregrinibacteria bacterium]
MKHSLSIYTLVTAVIILPCLASASEVDINVLSENIQTINQQRDVQENEYARSFAALKEIQKDIMKEREDLKAWVESRIQEENDLLSQLPLLHSLKNKIQLRARQRMMSNAKSLFAIQREEKEAALKEKEMAWRNQWEALKKSRTQSRTSFLHRKRISVRQIKEQRSKNVMSEIHSNLNDKNSLRNGYLENKISRYQNDKSKRSNSVKRSLSKARSNQYLNKVNPEVEKQLQLEKEDKIAEMHAMELKRVIERLSVIGPIDDELRSSVYLHIFGVMPEESK